MALAPEPSAGSGAGATFDDRTTAEILARAGRDDFWRFAEQLDRCARAPAPSGCAAPWWNAPGPGTW